ncbi:MAG TPA: glycine cleavage system aminomethyltransferase GcvT [Caulobacteraceae bacterium]
MPDLKTTPLTDAHRTAGARMVEFAGYSMPVQYADGVLKEHLWTREHCGLFDVSHMGPAYLQLNELTGDGEADHAAVAALIEPLICGDIRGLKRGQLRYTLLLDDEGGIVDDFMIGRPLLEDRQGMLYLVVNAGTKEGDFVRIADAAGGAAELIRADEGALIAVQGPEAEAVVGAILPEAAGLSFMTLDPSFYEDQRIVVSRSGYTGEDGFEILVPKEHAEALWARLCADPRARPIGLGARDSLRLEAGLPLYGHDLNTTISPIEASLDFAVSKRRLKALDFPGAARIADEAAGKVSRRRVGLSVEGAPAREGAEIVDAGGAVVGVVTSGGFSPTLGAPIAMGYVPPALAEPGAELGVVVRGRTQAARVTPMPFVPHRYRRKA